MAKTQGGPSIEASPKRSKPGARSATIGNSLTIQSSGFAAKGTTLRSKALNYAGRWFDAEFTPPQSLASTKNSSTHRAPNAIPSRGRGSLSRGVRSFLAHARDSKEIEENPHRTTGMRADRAKLAAISVEA